MKKNPNFTFRISVVARKLFTALLFLNVFILSTASLYSQSSSISFTQSSQTAEVEQGSSQNLLEYISTTDNTPVNAYLTAVDGSNNVPTWLTVNGSVLNGINYTTGSEITFNFDATNLSVGTYPAVVTASAPGYNDAVLDILLTVKSPSGGTLTSLKVNFQDSLTIPPASWPADFGQSFGPRTSANQGSGYSYGWLKIWDHTPVDLTQNGRKRNSPADILQATFMHMQGDDVANFTGTPIEGIWEAEVTNGNYDVTVSVGDGTVIDSKHSITVEGVSAISDFVPTSTVKFKTATITVSVADGFLTVDAIGGVNTKINYISIQPSTTIRPSVIAVNPENSSQNVSENSSVSTSILKLPNGGINNSTITSGTVYLTEEATGAVVPSNANGTGGGDAITLVPSSPLKLGTTYNFHITSGVQDITGAAFIPYVSRFTTGLGSAGDILSAKFDRIELPNATGRHSSLTLGPDGKLYALTIDGLIKRFSINSDGTLATPDTIYSLQDAYGTRQPRLAVGFAFDPSATANNLVAWVTHDTYVFLGAPDWDGKLAKLSGNNLQNVQDVLINLPRSARDHVTNSITFGPDGALYFTQGSTSAMGKADQNWGNRSEHLLSAAVLRLDVSKLGTLPLNVKTAEGGGTYNPYAANAPLTIYASGVRNAYDLVWHSNGNLYVATNGSAAGGNTPASVNGTLRLDGSTYNGPAVPALTNVQQTQKDFLFRVIQGGYYGHPNPVRGEYVMNGGNPSSFIDPAQVDAYPVGTMPDVNWRGYAFDFQNNKSPNGSIEYKSNTFNGALRGKLLVVRYSQHDDIITLTPGGPDNDIISSTEGNLIRGFSGFIDPLDLTEDVNTGNIYVSEYGGDGKIVLLKANNSAAPPSVVAMSPVADAFVRNGSYGNVNYGTDSILMVKSSSSSGLTRYAYLKFSLNTFNSVSSAKLRVYGRNTENATINLSAFGVDNDTWTENGITFSNAPAASTSALSTMTVNGQAQYYEFDVTNYIKTQFAGDKVVSLMIKDPANLNKNSTFNSREKAQNAPELVISTALSGGSIAVSPESIYDNDVAGGLPGTNRTVTINNIGSGVLSVSGVTIAGANSGEYVLNGLPVFPVNVNPGSSVAFTVAFNPSTAGIRTASLSINSDDTLHPVVSVPLRGLGTSGLGGSNEPSLQSIFNLLEIPITVGDDDPSTGVINSNSTLQKAALLGEEVIVPKFQKADTGNVTVTPLAVFGPTDSTTILGMGWYKSGNVSSKSELFTVSNNPVSNGQTVNVGITGSLSFNPASDSFGLYSRWPFFANRHLYSEDNLNTFSGAIPHHVRVYPYKNNNGTVPNAYVVAFEENISGFDYQDLVFVIKNVKPAATPAAESSTIIINPVADAFVRNGTYADLNYGSDSSLKVKSTSSSGLTRFTYLKFPLNNISRVNSAKLRLYGRNTNASDPTVLNISSYGIDNDGWAENGITFNNAPTTANPALSSVGVTNQAQYYEFDVTAYVQMQLTGDKLVSFLIKDPANKNINLSFNSKEKGQNLPQLVIDSALPTLTVNPIADAFVRDGSFAGTNYGSHDALVVKSTSSSGLTRYSYLKFQLNNISKIKGAKLRLFGRNTQDSSSVNLSLFGVNDDSWTESGITFNNAPPAATSVLSSTGVNNQLRYYELDVTNYVKSQFEADKVVSLLLKDVSNKNLNLSFNSKEKEQNIPQLLIDTVLSSASLFVENLDKFPSNDNFVFSRIQIPWRGSDSITYNSNHDSLKVRIHNKGINPLIISDLTVSDNSKWKIDKLNALPYIPGSGLPISINSGSFLDVTVKFIALDQASRVKILHETLAITSNDDVSPTKIVYLHGLWQKQGEGNHEPYAQEIIDAFGFKTSTGYVRNDPDLGDSTKLKGDEIKPSYFVRANTSLPVSVTQMAAYHGCCSSTQKLFWYLKGSTTNNTLFTHIGTDAQMVLPRTSAGIAASGTITTNNPFGFKVGDSNSTDASRNPMSKIGVRVWRAIDSKGNIIPNSYIFANDYLSDSSNYDYNDNLYYVNNVKPYMGSAFYSSLNTTPSALDFAEHILQTSDSLQLNISSGGKIYSDGSQDPPIVISSVGIAGQNQSEFSASMPAKTTLAPQEATIIKVKFNPLSQGLKIADLLISYNNSQSPLRVPLYGIAKASNTTVIANYRIKAGSSTSITVNGKTWSGDTQYAFDNLEPYTNVNLSQIAATDEDALYLREQSSNADKKPFRYEIAMPNGDYVVRLHFAEIAWGVPLSGNGGPGSRVMSIKLENELRLINLDVAQEVSSATAIIKNLPVTVTDGKLNIDFSATVNRPMVNAIEVYSFSSSAARMANKTTATSTTDSVPLFSMEQTDRSENNFERPKVYPNPLHKKFTIEFPSKYSGNYTAEIMDMVGRKYDIAKAKLKAGGSVMQVDITRHNLKAGVYFLRIYSEAGKIDLFKLVVE